MSGLSNQCDIYFCLSCGFQLLCVYKCQDFQPMWYILLFEMSPYVFINVRTFNQCDIYFYVVFILNHMSGLSTNVKYILSCGFHPMCWNVLSTMWYILLFVMWFSPLCVYKCQDFQPMWYILLFVMWFSSYVFINVRTFNIVIYTCLSCGFHPMCLWMSGLSTNDKQKYISHWLKVLTFINT